MKKLVMAVIMFASLYSFAGKHQDEFLRSTRISILVYNIAQVPSAALSRAEMTAQRMLDQAGVGTEWIDCKPYGPFLPQQDRCTEALKSLYVQINILREPTTQFQPDVSVFGYATTKPGAIGPACYIFSSRVRELAEASGFNDALVFGEVMTHELGHLLLGSNSHSSSGIMSGTLDREKIKDGTTGRLGFSRDQADKMRLLIAGAKKNLPSALVQSENGLALP